MLLIPSALMLWLITAPLREELEEGEEWVW